MEAESISKPSTRLQGVTTQKVTVLRTAHPRTETIIMYNSKMRKKKQACVTCPGVNA